MRVLVGYAGRHGSTQDIAEQLASCLRDLGVPAHARLLGPATDPAGYDACVLGSAIHSGNWLPEAEEFLRRHAGALARHPVWLFSVCTVGERSSVFPPAVAARLRRVRQLPATVAAVASALRPRDHHAFAGVVVAADWGLAGRVFMTALGGRYGDHRNWREVVAWADRIAVELTTLEDQPASRPAERARVQSA